MASVVVLQRAQSDLEEILRYLFERAGLATAKKCERSFLDLNDWQSNHPESGATRSRLGQGIGLNVVDPYNVYSRYDAATQTFIAGARLRAL
ncbi:MAG TPA: hypothetical protein DCL54_17085 [Alphaproteobacteria bacterium]|nr:hypothetical protein [Alphaproteobacteria bacterium]HAJ48291.1 hypothetical protein [Alphaproteobacteria bacterium]